MNTYDVTIYMVWAFSKTVKAENLPEAKRKAWEAFKKTRRKVISTFTLIE